MKQNDDPLYKFIEHFDEKNILNTEEKRKYMYKKISYNSYNVEYQQWKSRVLDRAFSKYNVHKSLRANAIWIIYKELEDNFDITLEDEYAFEARSKLEYVYMHEELRNFFMEKIIEHLEEFY